MAVYPATVTAKRLARSTPGPGLLFAAPAQVALRRGVTVMTDLVRPTLGPIARTVVLHEQGSGRSPEVLHDAATILRRVIDLPDPYANMGAMLLRHAAWVVHESVGDGAATTAVLFEAIVRETAPLIGAGIDPQALRRGLERGLAMASAALEQMARPLEGEAAIARVAEGLCHEPELARLLGEIFDIVGVDGSIEVQNGYSRGFDRQYVEGVQWNTGFFSTHFITNQERSEARLENPVVLITDMRLTEADQLLPLLDRLAAANRRDLFIIADDVSGTALSLLTANHRAGVVRSVAVRAPSSEPERTQILADLAILTGARVITEVSGTSGNSIALDDLGRARVGWAVADNFGLQCGLGDPVALRERISEVRAAYGLATNTEDRDNLSTRLGKLMGGMAILQVGGDTQQQMEERKATAERTIATVRHAMRGGVAPGGGTAYVACQPLLRRAAVAGDEAAAILALARALAEPLWVIARNAGHDPSGVVAGVMSCPQGYGFNAETGCNVDMWAVGILDPVPMLQRALSAAVSGAAMLLTAGVLVHHREPLKRAKP